MGTDPLELFSSWLAESAKTEPNDPNAMSLATIDADGKPSVRIVLLKGLDDHGFVFYTNRESRKGGALAANPVAALCFHWKSQRRQVRVEGKVELVSDQESDAYYNSRPRGSRIGAWASQQSRPLDSMGTLSARAQEFESKFEGQDIFPRPAYWGGYRVIPHTIEFWEEGLYRLHKRHVYIRSGDGWDMQMLYP